MHEPLDNKESIDIAASPKNYIYNASNAYKDGGRDPALIVTKEDILKIKRYERRGLNLPRTEEQLKQLMPYLPEDIDGITPKEIISLYLQIKSHAEYWRDIENKIKETGSEINIFSDNFLQTGNTMLRVLNDMEVSKKLGTTIDQVFLEELKDLPGEALSQGDTVLKTKLVAYLEGLNKDISRNKELADDLTQKLRLFSENLAEELLPAVNHKIVITRTSKIAKEVDQLWADTKQLKEDIDAKKREYDAAVKNISWGVIGGTIGVAITGGIFGAQAEKARKEKNNFIERYNKKCADHSLKSQVFKEIFELNSHFCDLQICLSDAEQASEYLHDLWAHMSNYIDNSIEKLKGITDSQDLYDFSHHFGLVVRPWEKIAGMNTLLQQIFEEALYAFENE